MKVLLVLCMAVAAASAGSTAWPGATVVTAPATVVKTVVPGLTKAFGFSTTQYINAVPSGPYLAYQPQVSYQVPQLSAIAPVHHTFVPVPGATYYPTTVFYPSHPGLIPAPVAPFPGLVPAQPAPFPGAPLPPGGSIPPAAPAQDPQYPGDADTAIVDSADFPQQNNEDRQQQTPSSESPQQNQPSAPQFPPASTFPNYPTLPQAPQGSFGPQFPQAGEAPSFPSLPQIPQGQAPQFPLPPQFPQESSQIPSFPGFPQFPQIPSFPQFPQAPSNPNIPQSPSPSPPSTFPGDTGGEKGLNDEDTVSVESA